MSTFIGQLIGFSILAWLAVKYVFPLVGGLMTKQQDAIREALAESAAASEKLANSDETLAKMLVDAKAEGARITSDAQADSVRIAEQLGEQAATDADRIKAQGMAQVDALRQQQIRTLRSGLGAESVRRAEEIVRAHVADPAAQAATVDRFLDELDSMAPADAALPGAVSLKLRAASRRAVADLVTKFEAVSNTVGTDELVGLADELAAVSKVLREQTELSRVLVTPADKPEAKRVLVDRVFAGQIGAKTLELVQLAAASPWSSEHDVAPAFGYLAQLALLVRAERLDAGEQVEDQLFQFGRVLDGSPELTTLLSDYPRPLDGRLSLLNDLLDRGGSVHPVTRELLAQALDLLHGGRIDLVVNDLAEVAVTRRGELVAQVAAAASLSETQRTRLTTILARIYGHPIALKLDVDPELLGGLHITIADEVIDGAIASRLTAARVGLPD
ncbi:F0F1 ATP synthase subunit B/delta [Mycolicibacterium fallax]|uniref:ATP synthase subunit delta n=1 Tax=Mycolicibacterium fallax TaxID=1793 RepID=A0A1X1R8C9_MYCFA|nr:F0F1 ATP synthase subunit B/delta [Mycolicibacterium fallax]ORV01001.1 ATP F0F1 synthase subunit delta [Mycolicibacterium fallax]BBY96562.1 ATP synthase subunit b-delta [Mycolicibacterium fallax]